MGGGGTRKKDFQHLVSEHLVLPYHCLLDSIRVPIQCTTQGDSLSSRSLTAVGGTHIFIWSGGWNHRSCCSVAHSLHISFLPRPCYPEPAPADPTKAEREKLNES